MSAWMLELGKLQWRLLAAGKDAAPPVAEREFSASELAAEAKSVCEVLAASGYRGEPIVVALGSAWCLSATLTGLRSQELRDRQTMLYRLEECIPWSIEDCVADYARAGHQALLVAAPSAPLAEFFQCFEELGVVIQSIVPQALLACAAHLARGDWPARHVILFQTGEWVNLLCAEDNQPTSWTTLPADSAAIGQELTHFALDLGTAVPFVGYGLDAAADAEIERSGAAIRLVAEAEPAETASTLALLAAAKIVQGQWEVPLELKRGPFGRTRGHVALRRYRVALVAALAVLLLSASSALLYQGQLAGRNADALAARQADVFQDVFPNAKVPVGIRSRLESELEKLKGLQGDESSLPEGMSAITMLHRMLAAMPADRRFRLLEIRIEEGRVYLDGEVIDHGDAENIAQRLRAEGFVVASPRTQRLDDKRVSLRITGTLAPAPRVATRKSSS